MSDELDELPATWISAVIGDVTVKKVDQQGPVGRGEFTYVDISSIDNAAKSISDAKQLPIENAPSRARQRIKSGDILVSMTRPNLNAVARVPQQFDGAIASTGFDVLRSSEVLPDWLFAHVRSKAFIDSMSELVRGALYPAVNAKEIREYRIPIPPLPEQRRIVAKIEALQSRSRKAREALEAIPSLLEQFRQSVLAAAFRGDLTADWREQHPEVEPASVLLDRIRTERRRKWEESELTKFKAKGKLPKDDSWKDRYVGPEPVDDADLPELPEGWCWTSFDDCASEITVGHVGPMKNRYVSEGITMLRSQNVRPLRFDISNCEYIPAEFDQELEKSRLHGNEILVVRSGVNVGDCCVYPAVEGKANCSDLVITRPLKGLNPSYAAMYVVSPIGKAALRLQRVGNAQPHFNVRSMKKSLFPLAPYDEQARIVGIVEQAINKMDEVIKSLEAESQLKQLDQSILAKAFRGELVPQDPNDEPASQLLERIQSERANDANAKPTRGRNKRSSVKAND